MTLPPDTRKLFVLSTGHLTKATAEEHKTYRDDAWLWPIPYGYMTWMWDTDEDSNPSGPAGVPPLADPPPPELFPIIRHLRTLGADDGDYIRFDCDGETLRGLATYDW